MHAAHDFADFLGLAQFVIGGAQRVVEHHDALGAAFGFDQRFHFRIVDALDLGLVVEIGNLGVVPHETEAVAVQHEILGVRAAVVNSDAARIGRAAGARVAAAGAGDDGEDLGSVVDDVVERRLDRVGYRTGAVSSSAVSAIGNSCDFSVNLWRRNAAA